MTAFRPPDRPTFLRRLRLRRRLRPPRPLPLLPPRPLRRPPHPLRLHPPRPLCPLLLPARLRPLLPAGPTPRRLLSSPRHFMRPVRPIALAVVQVAAQTCWYNKMTALQIMISQCLLDNMHVNSKTLVSSLIFCATSNYISALKFLEAGVSSRPLDFQYVPGVYRNAHRIAEVCIFRNKILRVWIFLSMFI